MASSPNNYVLNLIIAAAILLMMFLQPVALADGQRTRVGFYSASCPQAESIVSKTVKKYFKSDPTVAPGLLRMHFHDCFIQGCDASILIAGAGTERNAPPNLSLKGYEVIDDAKFQLEAACPGVVSCADILALAARDSVLLTKGITWAVPTGRRDGRISLASNTATLPSFRDSVDVQKQKFSDKGLNTKDLVALVGGHTIGTAACQVFRYRLYNFTTAGEADPTIDAAFLPQLRALCPAGGDGTRRVALDTGSGAKFDAGFFGNLRKGRGVLESDQRLWGDASTRAYVQRFETGRMRFEAEFWKSMVKMSNIGVKTGTDQGEIRRLCSALN
ncbi:hypothetical protein H6P81_011556 [Aristolochia fimbriata]|uniref:Peroxidase n=1 Tax=Aristolochia fimbriata TaxID=158543 RepID=A0AAV7EVD1_ARIFI|nr:hypothetical protein H6P81_011556 [Aristolochia fimbriata]